MIFDSHAHYDDGAFEEDRAELLESMKHAGVRYIMNVGASLRGVRDSIELAERYDFVYAAAGVHPDEVGELDEEKFIWLKEACKNKNVKAVGEIGLDYYWDKENHDIQKEWFIKQLRLSKEIGLPVIIHSREAAKDTMDIMKREHSGSTGGVIHCFSGSREFAREYVNMGYYIGIGGVVTFKNARVLKEVAAEVPLERILVETDCPYLAPVPFRGKRNTSLLIPHILEEIAIQKGITREEVELATYENAKKLYRIEE